MVLALTVDGSSRQNSVIPCLYPNEYKDLDANSFELFHLLKLYDNQFLQGERDWFASSIIYSATSIKHPGFYYEKEQRAVVSLSKEDSTPILHRTRNNTEIPYLEMLIPINAIKGIYIGPSTNQDNARLEVFNFLAENNLEHIEIKTSSIPYVS